MQTALYQTRPRSWLNLCGRGRYQVIVYLKLCLTFTCLALVSVAAAQVAEPGEYNVEVAVNGQGVEEKVSAYQVAMRIVLLRNSGDKTLLNRDDVREALADAESYVQQFSYRVPDPGEKITTETPVTRRVRESGEATHLLAVQFTGVRINALIQGQIRAAEEESGDDGEEVDEPPVPTSALVWLLIEDGTNVHLIGGQTGSNIVERAREIAGGIGQSLVFPTLDAEDRQLLTPNDIRTGNQARILSASDRYQQAVVLTGLLTRANGRSWVTSWSRYHLGAVEDLAGELPSLDQSLQQGINWLSPELPVNSVATANSGFGKPRTGAQALIWVSALDTTDRYARVMQLLSGIETVDVAYPQEIMDAGMLFAISPRVAVEDIARRIAQLNWIRASSVAAPLPGTSVESSSIRQADAFFEYLR